MITDLVMVSVVIPAYNEGSQIQRTLEAVTDYLTTIEDEYRWEVVVIDDGSTDDTRAVAEASAQTVSNVSIAPQPTNFNLGQALRYGFSLSGNQ